MKRKLRREFIPKYSYLNKMLQMLDLYIAKILQKEYTTKVYGLVRSLLALGLLVTLLFNSTETLFGATSSTSGLTTMSEIGLNKFTFFSLLKNNLVLAKILAIFLQIAVIIGYFPQVTGILQWWVSYSFTIKCLVIDGGDQISPILLLLLLPFCLLDSRKNHWDSNNLTKGQSSLAKFCLFFFYCLIQIQVCAIYFHAAISKFEVQEWMNGTVLWYWVREPLFGPSGLMSFIIDLILDNRFLAPICTWMVLLTELFIAAAIIASPKNKRLAYYFGIGLHVIIFLLFGLPTFSIVMIAALVIYLYPLEKPLKFFRYEI